jgi:predicted Zn-dependent protease
MRTGALLALCFLWLLSPPASAQTGQLERARQLVAAGRTEEAIAIYESLLQAGPDNPALRINLAVAHFKAGQYAQAIEHCRAALRRDSDLPTAWLFLGAGHFRLGQPKEAVEPLRKTLAAQPGDRNARLMLAESLLQLEDFAGAAEHFEVVSSSLADNTRVWYGLERSYHSLATAALERLERDAPGSPYLAALTGETYLERRQYRLAFRHLREAREALPTLPGLHAALAALYRQTGHAEWAAIEEEKERTLAQPDCSVPRNPLCFFAAARYRELASAGDSPEAVYWKIRALRILASRAYDKLAALPASSHLHEVNARKLDSLGRPLEAAKEWQKAVSLAPNDPVLEKGLALALYNGRDFRAALPLLEKLLEREPDSSDLLFLCGSAHLSLELPERALVCLEKAAKRDPHLLPVRGALGQAYLTLGRHQEAIRHLAAALPIDEDGTRHFQLAQAWRAAGQAERAQESLRKYRQLREAAEARRREFEEAGPITAP